MHKEIDFENDIEQALTNTGGYEKGDPKAYDPETALFPAEAIAFVQKTQPKIWTRLTGLYANKASVMLVDSLVKELASKGALTVLREGFKCVGKTVRLAYFAPNSGLDPLAAERYRDNRLTIVRQVNTRSGAIPDVVLAVNGLPVATLELKNPMSATRWNVENAKYQYRFERDPQELLFTFKKRCLVHFAVDTELAFMATKLEGKDTFFLPFNLGHTQGAGNPPADSDVRTTYLLAQGAHPRQPDGHPCAFHASGCGRKNGGNGKGDQAVQQGIDDLSALSSAGFGARADRARPDQRFGP